jgi:hypothetical protein
MNRSGGSSASPDPIRELLTCEVQSAQESYHAQCEQYRQTISQSNSEDSDALQSIYSVAREMRMARKRYRRAARTLTGFAAS